MADKQKKSITLEEITEDTLSDILNLEVTEEQKRLIASNAVSIAQAHFCRYSWMRAVYADEEPVGFVSLYLDPDTPRYEVWRFMIDQHGQQHGYGRQALKLIIAFVKSLPEAQELYLSYRPEKGNAAPFFKKAGFEDTGEFHGNEKVMKIDL